MVLFSEGGAATEESLKKYCTLNIKSIHYTQDYMCKILRYALNDKTIRNVIQKEPKATEESN